ncbi:hypothetical protein POSPLADRAFT_1069683 [Postia placenta MAD-698-R-SB12]|uniref:Uncharacterized protein n=1 Tax=Postia placenta MAD-698-R-SB12 TaxID=670580 RepID=A0A1X6N7F0_9APHY|nr:hypothetical protein POSPLADRAFT_1069683 [Postia placenta MAD-698-R-SB12]OSX64333.1 hypothetical protein POSPLADRAFT_1069683 [Postia placenta MAD-698-R-SB12]
MSAAPAQSSSVANIAPAAPAYPFLSQPPPQKKRPTQPLPTTPVQAPASPCKPVANRRRSATLSVIAAWAANVQPGSPAPLTPPRRRTSISSPRRPSISPRSLTRRASVTSSRAPSASFLNIIDTPTTSRITPSVKDFKHDLTAVGYTSVFVHFPNTPSSAAYTGFPDRRPSVTAIPAPQVPEASEKPARRGLKHFRSLSALKPSRSRSKSTTMPSAIPTKQVVPPVPAGHSRAPSKETVSKAKKSKYAKYRPPPLAAELALAQLADGGKMDDHIRRFAEAQARAGGAMVVDGKLVGVGDVWRDGEGGVWRDQDEEWEYAHLLGGDDQLRASDGGWERFGSGSASNSADGEEHRGSVSSQDSDLDPRYAMQAEGERDDLAVFGSAVMPSAMRKPGMSVLAIPTRHRRTAPHLRKPEFLLDVFPVPDNADAQPLCQLSSNGQQTRATGKERRRPAPLTLPPPSPASKAPMNPLDDTRKAFIENSFAPPPAPSPATHRQHHQRPVEPPRTPARVDSRPTTVRKMAFGGKSTIKMDMRGLLKVMGGKRDI